ncbi:glycerophosphodiester phosphodiesterase family protein [Lyngbya aestuarii]|uniref:glycerophosphodiester phosphodiesterase family protein n=1 Tax=Lyngbya aestuarii TaxID=118322 RepID=UPI00403D9D88
MHNLTKTIYVTAHRGSSEDAPENTLSALNLAIQQQADYAEIDVQQTKDGSLVALHDSNLKRVAGVDRHIWELTDKEVSMLDVGSWFSSDFAGERVPFFGEVIDVVKGKLKLNIELKINGHEQNLAERITALIDDHGLEKQCVITSFNYEILAQIKALNQQIATGLIIAKSVGKLAELNIDFYSIHKRLATADFIKTAHDQNRDVHVWTVNKIKDMKKLLNLQVDNIITNRPETLKLLLQKL